ncbi:hypothetical protein [Arenibacter latericius]|uniref:hypothetical protein n=1 Tax=Arenibacter latericius TaxID=86104 RepID=UPI000427BC3D|nr:hypothetical protein [Arenibacter latericius]
MKKFEVYRNIRKRAVIFGLPISLFALIIVSIVVSLMVIIFSFSLGLIVGAVIFNILLYITLIRVANNFRFQPIIKIFPDIISNKRNSGIDYEED